MLFGIPAALLYAFRSPDWAWKWPRTTTARVDTATTRLAAPAGVDVDVSWHAPLQTRINDLKEAVGAEGVYGFIFDSSETPEGEYGRYNWCNMPHARKTEYVRPPGDYELQYVEVVSLPSPTVALSYRCLHQSQSQE